MVARTPAPKANREGVYSPLLSDSDNEQACVGMALQSVEFFRMVITHLTEACFTQPKALACFRALVSLSDYKGVPPPQAVKTKASEFGVVVGVAEIAQWRLLAGDISDPASMIDILHELRRKRQVVELLQDKAVEVIGSASSQSLDVISEVEKGLNQIKTMKAKNLREGEEYFEIIGDISNIQSGKEQPFVSLGLRKLDNSFSGGFQYGTLNVIGARPGTGKTAITMWWLTNWHRDGLKAGFVSLEMTPKQIAYREYSMHTGIPYHRIMSGDVTPEEKSRLMDTAHNLKKSRFERICVGGCDISHLRSIIADMHFNRGVKIIVIDYLQRMRFEGKDNLVNLMGSAINEIKALAVQYNLCIVLLSQLSRESEKEKGGEPKVWHLRNSGMIEEAADTITLLHRPDMYQVEQTGVIRFLIDKNRNGSAGLDVHIHCDLANNVFNEEIPYGFRANGMGVDAPPY